MTLIEEKEQDYVSYNSVNTLYDTNSRKGSLPPTNAFNSTFTFF